MKLLFTKSKKLGSRLICWGAGEPVSHVAVVLGSFVIHATGRGVDIDYLPRFLGHYQVILSLVSPVQVDTYQELERAASWEGRCYDWWAVTYMAWRALLSKLFGAKWPPEANLISRVDFFDCVELASTLACDKELGHLTPYMLYQYLQTKGWRSP
jgi:hypothetical protein